MLSHRYGTTSPVEKAFFAGITKSPKLSTSIACPKTDCDTGNVFAIFLQEIMTKMQITFRCERKVQRDRLPRRNKNAFLFVLGEVHILLFDAIQTKIDPFVIRFPQKMQMVNRRPRGVIQNQELKIILLKTGGESVKAAVVFPKQLNNVCPSQTANVIPRCFILRSDGFFVLS